MRKQEKYIWENRSLENLKLVYNGIEYFEQWKDIEPFKGLYRISNFGRVKCIGRRFMYANLGWITTEDRVMKLRLSTQGYPELGLTKGGKTSWHLVHRLVAKAFIKNKELKKTVNHMDGDRSNSLFFNLEWNTYQENLKHSFSHLGRIPTFQTYHGEKHPMARKVRCTTLDIEFTTMKEACEKLDVNKSSLTKVCNNKTPHTKGLSFIYI